MVELLGLLGFLVVAGVVLVGISLAFTALVSIAVFGSVGTPELVARLGLERSGSAYAGSIDGLPVTLALRRGKRHHTEARLGVALSGLPGTLALGDVDAPDEPLGDAAFDALVRVRLHDPDLAWLDAPTRAALRSLPRICLADGRFEVVWSGDWPSSEAVRRAVAVARLLAERTADGLEEVAAGDPVPAVRARAAAALGPGAAAGRVAAALAGSADPFDRLAVAVLAGDPAAVGAAVVAVPDLGLGLRAVAASRRPALYAAALDAVPAGAPAGAWLAATACAARVPGPEVRDAALRALGRGAAVDAVARALVGAQADPATEAALVDLLPRLDSAQAAAADWLGAWGSPVAEAPLVALRASLSALGTRRVVVDRALADLRARA